MRRFKNNSGLLNKKRFKAMREEHIRRLRSLTVQKSAEILQSLTSVSAQSPLLKTGTQEKIKMTSLSVVFRKTISFLKKQKYDYLVIGGIAASVLGNPRMTQDVDICIFLRETQLKKFLEKAGKSGFSFNRKEVIQKVKETGTFDILCGKCHIDFIIASTELEEEALKKRQELNVYGIKASFPTPEDLILLKIVPGRHIDLADIENVINRRLGRLDKKYILNWAQRLSDEAEDMRIYNTLKEQLEIDE